MEAGRTFPGQLAEGEHETGEVIFQEWD